MKIALKLPQMNRSWLMLGGAVLLGIVAVTMSQKLLRGRMAEIEASERNRYTMIDVVVASHDVERGELISPETFATRAVPASYAPASAVHPEDFGRYAGMRLSAPMKSGEALTDVYIELPGMGFSLTLATGNRALTTEVDEVNSISGMLQPSDHIDLLVTARGSGASSKEITFPLLTNVEVLATGQATRKSDAGDQQQTYTTITLSVSPQDAQRIIVAKNSGKLTAVLRNPEDSQPGATAAMNIDDVLPKKPRNAAAQPVRVEYIVGQG